MSYCDDDDDEALMAFDIDAAVASAADAKPAAAPPPPVEAAPAHENKSSPQPAAQQPCLGAYFKPQPPPAKPPAARGGGGSGGGGGLASAGVNISVGALQATMRRCYGFDSFRTGQLGAVRAVLAGHDAAVFMATGSGKSLCYQLPALHAPGSTVVVVSPLISLMEDQVGVRVGPSCVVGARRAIVIAARASSLSRAS